MTKKINYNLSCRYYPSKFIDLPLINAIALF